MLAAAKKFGVRRVLLTSSISAMVPNPACASARVVDDSSWTDLDYCRQRQKWYPVSKTLGEKAAWEYAKENRVDVVAINPATCLGQLLQPGLNATSDAGIGRHAGWGQCMSKMWLSLNCCSFNLPKPRVDTNGIYQFAAKVASLFPQYPLHRFNGETQPGLAACEDAAKRLIELGLKFTPVEEAVKDTVLSLEAKGFLGH